MNTAMTALKRIIVYGAFLALGIAVVGSIVGLVVDGGRGVLSAVLGTAIAFIFVAVTAGSVILADRASGSDFLSPLFFGIVLGGWILKFVVFLVALVLLKDQPWVNTLVLFLSIIVAVLGSLVVDVLVIAKARIPYVSDVTLPGDATSPDKPAS